MEKNSKNLTGNQETLDLDFLSESPIATGVAPVLDLEMEICGAIKASISASHKSRDQIIDRMNMTLVDSGYEVTSRKLNQWLAPSQCDKRFPAWSIAPVCWATSSILVLQRIANALGYELVDKRDQQALEYGQLMIEQQQAKRRAAEIKRQLEGK